MTQNRRDFIEMKEREGRVLTSNVLDEKGYTYRFTNNFTNEDNHIDCFTTDGSNFAIEIKRRYGQYSLNHLLTDHSTRGGAILEKIKYDSFKEYQEKGYHPYLWIWTADNKLIYFNIEKIKEEELFFRPMKVRKNNWSDEKVEKTCAIIPWSWAENFDRDIKFS